MTPAAVWAAPPAAILGAKPAAGRADYEAHQRAFSTRAEPLRTRLLTLCERLLA